MNRRNIKKPEKNSEDQVKESGVEVIAKQVSDMPWQDSILPGQDKL